MTFLKKIYSIAALGALALSQTLVNAATPAQQNTMASASSKETRVNASIELLERTSSQLKFRLKVTNEGDYPVLIVTDPVRADGTTGPYLLLAEDDPSLLKLAFEVFPPPAYTILAPKNRVTYASLEPDKTYEKEVLLIAPLVETKPPWGTDWRAEAINISAIRDVYVGVGVLCDQPEVREAFASERTPTGLEMIKQGELKGKSLFEIQTTVLSKRIHISARRS
jgi:hypothetical protein